MPFREVSLCDLPDNMFGRIGSGWMLVTAGQKGACNTMTASWGQMGWLWNKPVATAYIRPSRYTKEFVDREERFSLSFFEPGTRRNELNLLGTKSGRDGDKIAEAGLAVMELDGVAAFEEANLVFICRKLYAQTMQGGSFLDERTDKVNYPAKDYHTMYIGEVEKVYVKE